jgi:hypothetical protein
LRASNSERLPVIVCTALNPGRAPSGVTSDIFHGGVLYLDAAELPGLMMQSRFIIFPTGGKMRIFVILLLHILIFVSAACSDRSTIITSNGTDENVGPPVTRSEVILTADKYVRLHWTMSAVNRNGITCGDYFVSDYPVGDRIGMGYKWGGWNDIDDFMQKIEAGYGTGTGAGADTYANYSIDCVVGVSCTGFVSRAWHLNEKYTLCYPDPDIPRKFCDITCPIEGVDLARHRVTALKKGDAFINAYHTILFVYETRSGFAMVMDSSTPGVRFRQVPWNHLSSDGYTAIRYNNIQEVDQSSGTIVNPVTIHSDEFPFIHEGNTRDVVSMEFDKYSIAPAISQVGPEVVYQLQMNSSASVTITITNLRYEGINNDIYLLASLQRDDSEMMATDCIARADISLHEELNMGSYYIIIDSCSDLPGEYTLTVDSN